MAAVSSSQVIAETEGDETPDMALLEYLGMWEETDEDWLALDEVILVDDDKRSDPVPEGEESTEIEDED